MNSKLIDLLGDSFFKTFAEDSKGTLDDLSSAQREIYEKLNDWYEYIAKSSGYKWKPLDLTKQQAAFTSCAWLTHPEYEKHKDSADKLVKFALKYNFLKLFDLIEFSGINTLHYALRYNHVEIARKYKYNFNSSEMYISFIHCCVKGYDDCINCILSVMEFRNDEDTMWRLFKVILRTNNISTYNLLFTHTQTPIKIMQDNHSSILITSKMLEHIADKKISNDITRLFTLIDPNFNSIKRIIDADYENVGKIESILGAYRSYHGMIPNLINFLVAEYGVEWLKEAINGYMRDEIFKDICYFIKENKCEIDINLISNENMPLYKLISALECGLPVDLNHVVKAMERFYGDEDDATEHHNKILKTVINHVDFTEEHLYKILSKTAYDDAIHVYLKNKPTSESCNKLLKIFSENTCNPYDTRVVIDYCIESKIKIDKSILCDTVRICVPSKTIINAFGEDEFVKEYNFKLSTDLATNLTIDDILWLVEKY
jgi:hypothetical protein